MQTLINNDIKVGAVILAAGFSSRMKSPKSLLKFDTERVFIEKIIDDFFNFGCKKIVVTINPEVREWDSVIEKYKSWNSVLFKVNDSPESERFYSIKKGLESIGEVDYCFIHNTDNPFLDKEIFAKIYKGNSETGYTVPVNNGRGGHPILLSKNVIENIIKEQEIEINFKEFLKDYERINVEVRTDKIHININTKEEYEKYFGKY